MRVICSLIFGCGLRGMGGDLFEDRKDSEGSGYRRLMKEGYGDFRSVLSCRQHQGCPIVSELNREFAVWFSCPLPMPHSPYIDSTYLLHQETCESGTLWSQFQLISFKGASSLKRQSERALKRSFSAATGTLEECQDNAEMRKCD